MRKRYSLICINSFKYFVCFCGCSHEFKTKLNVTVLVHKSKLKQITFGAATDELIALDLPFGYLLVVII